MQRSNHDRYHVLFPALTYFHNSIHSLDVHPSVCLTAFPIALDIRYGHFWVSSELAEMSFIEFCCSISLHWTYFSVLTTHWEVRQGASLPRFRSSISRSSKLITNNEPSSLTPSDRPTGGMAKATNILQCIQMGARILCWSPRHGIAV